MGDLSAFMDSITGFVGLLAVVVATYFAAFVFFRLSPVVHIDLLSVRRIGSRLVCDLQIENKSDVRIRLDRQKGVLLQAFNIDEYDLEKLPRHLPFSGNTYKGSGYPAIWKEPEKIFATTIWIYPRARVQSQLLIDTQGRDFTHFGVQVHALFGFPERWILGRKLQRWTRTFIELNKVG
jgi:hypothetical protein